MKDKVTLVSPNTLGSYRSANINDENLALGYLAAALEKHGYRVEIIDARMDGDTPDQVAERIHSNQPFFIGISTISEESMTWIDAMLSALGSFGGHHHVCMGGYYPSLQPETVLYRLPSVDSVVRGEGELTIVELVERIASERPWSDILGLSLRSNDGLIKSNPRRPLITNLDSLSLPRRYSNHQTTEIVIEGSRGCYGKCTFCAVGPHFHAERGYAWRGRSPEHIVSEILQLRRLYPDNIRYRFIDPDFFGSASDKHSRRVLRLAALMRELVPGIELYVEARVIDIRRRDVVDSLRLAGLKEVYLGIESGSERILTHMGKHSTVADTLVATRLLDDLGINYQYGYMMITPWTEYQDVLDSLALLRIIGRVQFDKLFNELYLIPGTALVEQVRDQCQLIREKDTGYYFYESNQLVKNLRALNIAFETRYRKFSEVLWHLYKDVQKHEQCHVKGATTIQRQLSALFIAVFEFCLERSKGKTLSETDTDEIVVAAITNFQGEALTIRKMLDPSIVFA